LRRAVHGAVLGDGVTEAVPLLLPQVLRGVPVRAGGHLRQQANKASCPCYNNWKTKRGGPKGP
ncbi:hypothetical protein BAE44_0003471, partial [Dichanthelium oligosanthes]